MCSASRIASWPTRRTSLGALEILTRPRVDLDLVPHLHEERYVDLETRLERRGLRRAGRGVALQTEVRRGDGHDDRGRHVDADRLALVLVERDLHPVREVVHGIAELVGIERELVVRLRVHEMEVRAVLVHELHGAVVEAGALEALAGLDRLLDEVTLADVAQLHAHLRAATAHLDVLELDDLVELAVDLDRDTALDLPGAYHCFFFVSSMSQRSATS